MSTASSISEAWRLQARRAYQDGEIPNAIRLFRLAAEAPGASAAVFLELAEVLWANFDFADGLATLGMASDRAPSDPAPALLAAKRLFTLGRWAEAARWVELALARRPGDHTFCRMLAELRDREGKLEEAAALAREALAANPLDAQAARALAHALRRSGGVEEAEEILTRHLFEHPGPDDWRLQYELAVCRDRRGDYCGAMGALEKAKAQLRPVAEPLLGQWRLRADRRRTFARALDRATLERWQRASASLPRAVPLAILAGHPRSGTTLLEQLLASHPGVLTTDETGILRTQFLEPIVFQASSTEDAWREVDEFDLEQLAAGREVFFRATAAHLGERLDGRLLIEKDPLATQDLGFILRLLPEARVIFPLRDPRDVCVSFFFTLVPLNADSAPALDLGSTCAAMALTLELWRHWRERIPQGWTEVRYEQLVRQPEQPLRELAQALDLSWEPSMLKPATPATRGVRSPTYADVAQPLYSRAIGRWRHYASWLEPHWAPLQEYLQEFGYTS
jgi:tetratricopeptide (TPR) repeat protein